MYDLNMKEIKFPEGLMPLDIFVGSIAKERATETIEGRSGIVDYGTNYVDRSVELSMWINSSDTTDYRLLRNELYALFDTGNAFYIEETRVPSRVLKVAVDESFIPDRLTIRNASVDVTCRTLDSVFWESKYTTLELHDSGYAATAEKYGLVDNIDVEKVKYRYNQSTSTKSLSSLSFEQGMIASANGNNANSVRHLRTTGYYSIKSGASYTFEDLGDNPDVSNWWIFIYDDYNAHTETISTYSQSDKKSLKFIASGSKLRMFVEAATDKTFSVSDIRSSIKPSLIGPADITNFNVYNAGNVTVEPESMYLNIGMRYVTTG